jgi:plastocyanin
MGNRARAVLVLAIMALTATAVPSAVSAGASSGSTYAIRVDGPPPAGENWAFLRFFPGSLRVHTGDVVDFAWQGSGAPHSATIVPGDAFFWRLANQGPGDPYQTPILDTAVGGDDGDTIENPAVLFPSDPACGTTASPCSFDGTGVVSSGLQFSDPAAQPAFSVVVDAPVGEYSFLCLIHPDMQIPVSVVDAATSVPSPAEVDQRAANDFQIAVDVSGPAADEQAQSVNQRQKRTGGRSTFTISAGGFVDGVSADEYPDDPINVRVGDHVRFRARPEIHTATFPASAAGTTPFVVTVCEQPGVDPPATSPFDCADPAQFQVVYNEAAITPTSENDLSDPSAFRNSGLLFEADTHLTDSTFAPFDVVAPGTYTFVCLVHGPAMSGTIIAS